MLKFIICIGAALFLVAVPNTALHASDDESQIQGQLQAQGQNVEVRTGNKRAASSAASLYSAQCKKEGSGQGMGFGFGFASMEPFCTSYMLWVKTADLCAANPQVMALVQDEVPAVEGESASIPAEPTYTRKEIDNPKCADEDERYRGLIIEYEGVVGWKHWRARCRKYVPLICTTLPL